MSEVRHAPSPVLIRLLLTLPTKDGTTQMDHVILSHID